MGILRTGKIQTMGEPIGERYVKALWFEQIDSGASGTLTPPAQGEIVLDQWAAGVDALASTIASGIPAFISPATSGGIIITATLDASGNWALSGTPSAYPIAIVYAYQVKFKFFDYTKQLGGYELIPSAGGVFTDVAGFGGKLSSADSTVQKALETLDDHGHTLLHNPVSLAASADSLLGLSTQELSLDTQAANLLFAGPASGAAAAPTFRSLVNADFPATLNPTFAGLVVPSISPAADFVLTQNSVAVMTSVGASAVVNTLCLKEGKVGIGTTGPSGKLEVFTATGDNLVYGGNPRLYLKAATGINGLRIDADTTPFQVKNLTANGACFSIGGDINTTLTAPNATAGVTTQNSPQFLFTGTYWNGSANATAVQGGMYAKVISASPLSGGLSIGGRAGVDTLFITTTDKVGIGLVTPGNLLSVAGAVSVGSSYASLTGTGATDGMIIQGNVGIGTTGPGAKLDVQSAGSVTAIFKRTAASSQTRIQIGNPTRDYYLGLIDGVSFGIADGGNTVLTIQNTSGNVGIGITSPQSNLHIYKLEGGIETKDAMITLGGYSTQGATIASYRYESDSNSRGLMFSTRNTGVGMVDAMTITGPGNVGIGTIIPSELLTLGKVNTITGAVVDGYAAALRLDPGYTAATALTVTRHNYIDVQDVSVDGAGPAAVIDAAVFRFDAAIGIHKAVDAASTKTTPSEVDAWMKVNLNGVIGYVPVYLSKTA